MSDEEEDAIINKSVEVTPPRVDADPEHEESEAPTSDEEEDTDSVVMSDVGSDSSGEDMKEAYTDDMCCTKCGATDREELMVLCDGEGCNTGWHTFCLTPMLPQSLTAIGCALHASGCRQKRWWAARARAMTLLE